MYLPTTRVIRNEKMQSMHACSTGGERRVEVSRPLLLGRHIALGQRRARAEEIILHLALEKLTCLGVVGSQAGRGGGRGRGRGPRRPRRGRGGGGGARAE